MSEFDPNEKLNINEKSKERLAKGRDIVNEIKAHFETLDQCQTAGWFVTLATLFKKLDEAIDVKEAIKIAKVNELLDRIKDGDVEINVVIMGPKGDA